MKGAMRITFFLCTAFLFVSTLFPAEFRLGSQTLEVEIADTESARAKGLMGRTHLAEGTGMLFVYPTPQILAFWMKNTLLPLSIGFFDEKQRLIQVLHMDPPVGTDLPRTISKEPAQYALEVPQGWFEAHQIYPGAKFFLKKENQ